MILIDTHSHLTLYEGDIAPILGEINRNNIVTISNSMGPVSYSRNKEIAAESPLIIPIFGIHPWHASKFRGQLEQFDKDIEETPMIGEIGLDYFFVEDRSQYPAQRETIEYFFAKAEEQRKIVNLHTKGAESEIIELLDRYRVGGSIVHWYSGPLELIDKFLAAGSYFTIGVELLFSEHIVQIAERLPADRLLTETDNPGGYHWLTGEIGMPKIIESVMVRLAEMRKMQYVDMAQLIRDNWERLISRQNRLRQLYLKAVSFAADN